MTANEGYKFEADPLFELTIIPLYKSLTYSTVPNCVSSEAVPPKVMDTAVPLLKLIVCLTAILLLSLSPVLSASKLNSAMVYAYAPQDTSCVRAARSVLY